MLINVATVPDTIPETDETFLLEIFSDNPEILGSPSTVSITILANDDWNGVFSFAADSLDLTIGNNNVQRMSNE